MPQAPLTASRVMDNAHWRRWGPRPRPVDKPVARAVPPPGGGHRPDRRERRPAEGEPEGKFRPCEASGARSAGGCPLEPGAREERRSIDATTRAEAPAGGAQAAPPIRRLFAPQGHGTAPGAHGSAREWGRAPSGTRPSCCPASGTHYRALLGWARIARSDQAEAPPAALIHPQP